MADVRRNINSGLLMARLTAEPQVLYRGRYVSDAGDISLSGWINLTGGAGFDPYLIPEALIVDRSIHPFALLERAAAARQAADA